MNSPYDSVNYFCRSELAGQELGSQIISTYFKLSLHMSVNRYNIQLPEFLSICRELELIAKRNHSFTMTENHGLVQLLAEIIRLYNEKIVLEDCSELVQKTHPKAPRGMNYLFYLIEDIGVKVVASRNDLTKQLYKAVSVEFAGEKVLYKSIAPSSDMKLDDDEVAPLSFNPNIPKREVFLNVLYAINNGGFNPYLAYNQLISLLHARGETISDLLNSHNRPSVSGPGVPLSSNVPSGSEPSSGSSPSCPPSFPLSDSSNNLSSYDQSSSWDFLTEVTRSSSSSVNLKFLNPSSQSLPFQDFPMSNAQSSVSRKSSRITPSPVPNGKENSV